MCFTFVDYLNFSNVTYEVYEDEVLCFNLTLAKPALFDTTIEVIVSTNGKFCSYVLCIVMLIQRRLALFHKSLIS